MCGMWIGFRFAKNHIDFYVLCKIKYVKKGDEFQFPQQAVELCMDLVYKSISSACVSIVE